MVRQAAELELTSSTRDGVVVVTARGVLDVSTAGPLRTYLAKVATDQPRAIVVDIAGLDIRSRVAATAFATAHAGLAEWPGVPMVLVSPDGPVGDVLTGQRLERFLPVRPTVADAVAAAGEPPPRLVDRLLLPNDPASPAVARRFAWDSCVLWDHPELAADAATLLGELVANVVTHTRSVARIRVELRRELLSVAAYDDDPRQPEGVPGTGGLALVARTATGWGCFPTSLGGEVVLATIRVAEPGHRRRRDSGEWSVSRGERP